MLIMKQEEGQLQSDRSPMWIQEDLVRQRTPTAQQSNIKRHRTSKRPSPNDNQKAQLRNQAASSITLAEEVVHKPIESVAPATELTSKPRKAAPCGATPQLVSFCNNTQKARTRLKEEKPTSKEGNELQLGSLTKDTLDSPAKTTAAERLLTPWVRMVFHAVVILHALLAYSYATEYKKSMDVIFCIHYTIKFKPEHTKISNLVKALAKNITSMNEIAKKSEGRARVAAIYRNGTPSTQHTGDINMASDFTANYFAFEGSLTKNLPTTTHPFLGNKAAYKRCYEDASQKFAAKSNLDNTTQIVLIVTNNFRGLGDLKKEYEDQLNFINTKAYDTKNPMTRVLFFPCDLKDGLPAGLDCANEQKLLFGEEELKKWTQDIGQGHAGYQVAVASNDFGTESQRIMQDIYSAPAIHFPTIVARKKAKPMWRDLETNPVAKAAKSLRSSAQQLLGLFVCTSAAFILISTY